MPSAVEEASGSRQQVVTPQQECQMASFLAAECRSALAALPTTLEQDETALAASLRTASDLTACNDTPSDTIQYGCCRSADAAAIRDSRCMSSQCQPRTCETRALGATGNAASPAQLQCPDEPSGMQSAAGQSLKAPKAWLQHANRQLALQWRVQRKRLLGRAACDLLTQSHFLQLALEQ